MKKESVKDIVGVNNEEGIIFVELLALDTFLSQVDYHIILKHKQISSASKTIFQGRITFTHILGI